MISNTGRNSLKDLFLLDPETVFLNHGSFGATPRPVFEVYQAWQLELEHQPAEFLGRRAQALLQAARARLGAYLGVEADEIVYFPNPTTAINMVARNLGRQDNHPRTVPPIKPLTPGEEILTTNHEYGAMDRTWRYICRLAGARYVQRPIPIPVYDSQEFVENFWAGVNQRTRLIFISHITSPTALTFPVVEICWRARQAGILTIVDGAHAPGQIALNLKAIGADIYTGACHKWLCAPKGAAFLYVRPELQGWLDPLVISWGYEAEPGFASASQYVDYHEWQGTRDLASFLSVPAAIDFQASHGWETVRERCHQLGVQTRQRLNALIGLEPLCPQDWFRQMFTIRLPDEIDPKALSRRLYDQFNIEALATQWDTCKLMRVSFQGYNDQSDADKLLDALQVLL